MKDLKKALKRLALAVLPLAFQDLIRKGLDKYRTRLRLHAEAEYLNRFKGGYLVRLYGSLGSQLSQYAYALKLKDQGHDVGLETSSFGRFRRYRLQLGGALPALEIEDVQLLAKPWPGSNGPKFSFGRRKDFLQAVFECELGGEAPIPNSSTVLLMDGVWQSSSVNEQIVQEIKNSFFTLSSSERTARLLREISFDSVAILLKRKEAVTHPELLSNEIWPADRLISEYELEISRRLAEKPQTKFIVFSDEIEWAEAFVRRVSNLPAETQVIGMSWESLEDVTLLVQFKDVIACNHLIGVWVQRLCGLSSESTSGERSEAHETHFRPLRDRAGL